MLRHSPAHWRRRLFAGYPRRRDCAALVAGVERPLDLVRDVREVDGDVATVDPHRDIDRDRSSRSMPLSSRNELARYTPSGISATALRIARSFCPKHLHGREEGTRAMAIREFQHHVAAH